MSQEKNEPVSLDLDFAPSWARQSPEEMLKRYARDSRDGDDSGRDDRGRRGSDRGGDRRDRPPPRRDDRRGGFEKMGRRPRDERAGPPPPPGAAVAPLVRREEAPAAGRPAVGRPASYDWPPRGPQAGPEPVPFELLLLPEQKALGTIIRRIQTSHRAYPLRDIAHLFLDNPASCLMRLEVRKEQPQNVRVYQCKVCGLPALTEEEIAAHIAATHLDHFFTVADIEGEAPSGNFTCVARCGLSGAILGPPNHHSYAAKVQELLRTRYANLSPEAYHARIEMVRDPEVIEQWREQAKKKRIYRLKQAEPAAKLVGQEELAGEAAAAEPAAEAAPAAEPAATEPVAEAAASPALERDAAERQLQREIVPGQITAARSLIATVEVARKTTSPQLAYALREALFRENKFPVSLFFALRGAFRHRKLHLFKANDPKGPDFVVVTTPTALDVTHATEELRTMLGSVNDHPGTTRQELFGAIAANDEAKQQAAGTSLNWLVERGHLIEYYNGVLCTPMEHPKFRYLPNERPGGGTRDAGHRREEPKRRPVPQKAAPVASAPATVVEPAAAEPVAAVEPAAAEPATVE